MLSLKNIFIAFAVLQGNPSFPLPPAWYYLFLTLHLQLKPVGASVVQHLPKSVCECWKMAINVHDARLMGEASLLIFGQVAKLRKSVW